MKILLLDIETAPSLAYIWGIWQENIPLERLLESGYILCWAAKWLGEDEIFFDSVQTKSQKGMLRTIYKLLDEADAVMHYNGKKFDIPTLNREFVEVGWTPPSPYKQIDLLETVRGNFKLPSYKLEYVAKFFGIGEKFKHSGFSVWDGCIRGDKASWEEMSKYNKIDTTLLEALYFKLQPWIKRHPNYSLYSDDRMVCPNCGGHHLVKRGTHKTLHSIFQRYKCKGCGKWCHDNKRLNAQEFKTVGIE